MKTQSPVGATGARQCALHSRHLSVWAQKARRRLENGPRPTAVQVSGSREGAPPAEVRSMSWCESAEMPSGVSRCCTSRVPSPVGERQSL
jgi:hypothetical protein